MLSSWHSGGAAGSTTLTWSAPASPGGNAIAYDNVSAAQPDAFDLGTCVETDATVLAPGQTLYFVVRGGNICGEGTSGTDSASTRGS